MKGMTPPTTDKATARPDVPKLPAGAKGMLPTIWGAFVITVALALAFSFANVWLLDRTLHVERHVAPLIGPAVDITAFGLLIVVPWLVMAGVAADRLRPANRLMATAGFLTLALNCAPSAIEGWVHNDAAAWGRAAVESIVPFLLIAWSHVGPKLIGLVMEVRERHQERVAAALRLAEERSVEAAERRRAEVAEAVAEALRLASVESERRLAEVADRLASVEAAYASATEVHRSSVEALTRRAEEANAAAERAREAAARGAVAEAMAASIEEQHQADLEAATQGRVRAEAEVARLREAAKARRAEAPRKDSKRAPRESVEDVPKAPRRSAAELLEERVEAAKEALPTWQLETPSGPEIRSALGLKSDGVISDIRKRLDADRLAQAASNETN